MRQKRKRIFISVLCGLVAALLMSLYASSVRNEADKSRIQTIQEYGGEQIEVYVANRNIAIGERLTTTNVSKQIWLVDFLPDGALTEADDVIGQVLGIPMQANEPVTAAKIKTNTSPVSVPDGYCAVSIPTNDVLAVGGAINTGSIIAIYAADKETVVLLAAEVLVLDTSNNSTEGLEHTGLLGSSRTRPALTWVTLAVREDMVEDIIAASRAMNLYLVLPGGEY
ncbi:MAG: Flp pilus assembly protein CpaB [Coriobacteriales bacterium]|jgi:pilus assembly protein CpaB|nr:Flp pilus assembly protein CpaB [Coriobacteriales bacterium]